MFRKNAKIMLECPMNFLKHLLVMIVGLACLNEAFAGVLVDKFQGNGAGNGLLPRADQVIAGTYPVLRTSLGNVFSTINFSDSGNFGSFPDPTNLWPDNVFSDDFVIHITGFLQIQSAGTYNFRTHNDDGLRFSIDGSPLIVDSNYHSPGFVVPVSRFLTVGSHAIDLVFFEGFGQATLELQVLNSLGNWVLVGDAANGGLELTTTSVSTVPEPASFFIAGFGLVTALGSVFKRKRNSSSRISCPNPRGN